jgi:excisionase family DNA binding protein
MRKHYTPAQVATLLGVTRKTVYAWIHSGYLPAARVGPKLWHVTQAQLEALQQAQGVPVVPPPVVKSNSDPSGRSGVPETTRDAATPLDSPRVAITDATPALKRLVSTPPAKGRKK